jgi:hypothetical protein
MEAAGFVNLYLLGPQNLLFPWYYSKYIKFLLLPNVLSQENSICHGYAKSDNFEITL